MSHYVIDIPVEKEYVKIIKEHLSSYMDQGGGISVTVHTDNEIDMPPELADVFRKLFVMLVVKVHGGKFKGLS